MQSPPERPVYLLGESFGGVMALAVAEARPDLVRPRLNPFLHGFIHFTRWDAGWEYLFLAAVLYPCLPYRVAF